MNPKIWMKMSSFRGVRLPLEGNKTWHAGVYTVTSLLLSGDLRREVERGPTFEGLCDSASPESSYPSGKSFVHYLPGNAAR